MALKEGCLVSVTIEINDRAPIDLVGVYTGLESIGWNTYFTLDLNDDELGSVITMHSLDDVTRITYYPQQKEDDDDDDDTKQDDVPF